MSVDIQALSRFFEEIDDMSLPAMLKYRDSVLFVIANRSAILNRLRGKTVEGLKLRVAKERSSSNKINKQVSKALVYKLLSVLTRDELRMLDIYLETGIKRGQMEELVRGIMEEEIIDE